MGTKANQEEKTRTQSTKPTGGSLKRSKIAGAVARLTERRLGDAGGDLTPIVGKEKGP